MEETTETGCDDVEWIEIAVKTTTEATEAVANIFYDAGIKGVVIEDPKDLDFANRDDSTWDYVDEEVFQYDYEGVLIKGYLLKTSGVFEQILLIRNAVHALPHYGLDIGEGILETREIHEEEWSENWKQYYKPTNIGRRVVIKPQWEEYRASEGELVIDMNPGMAFGTGTHETTRMCLEAIEEEIRQGDRVLDIGCGSGILSILSAKLGAETVIAVDLDEVAVKVSRENVKMNGTEGIVTVRQGNLMETIDPEKEKSDLILINIIADVIILMAPDLPRFLAPGGKLILSGIILEKTREVRDAMEKLGVQIIREIRQGEWSALVCQGRGAE